MVAKGNPRNVQSLSDLADPSLRVSMPNPDWEGIATPIQKSYLMAGGEELKQTVMDKKEKAGTTYLTHIHHRQSPMRIMAGLTDVAPVWHTEAKYQASANGDQIGMVEIPESENVHVTYTAGSLNDAPHPEAAEAFMDFLTSESARDIIWHYGFELAPDR